MKTKAYIILSVMFSIISTTVNAEVVVCGEKEYTRLEQHGNGGYITDDSPGNGSTRVLTAHPKAGYQFAEWVVSGVHYSENPLTFNFGAKRANVSLSAYFVKSNAYVDGWNGDNIYIRSKSTDLHDGSDQGYCRIYANGERIVEDESANEKIDFGYWRIDCRELMRNNAHAGQKLHIVFYDDCSQISGVIDTIVPTIISRNMLASSLSFPAGSNVNVLPGVTLTIDENTAIDAELVIHPGGKVVVRNEAVLTVNGLSMQGNAINKQWAQLVANGGIINRNNNIVNYDYTLDWNYWYPFAVPYEVDCSKIRSLVHGGTAFFTIWRYNSAKRSMGKYAWELFDDLAPGAKLESGKGYIIWAEPTKWNGQYQDKQPIVVRFPMKADLTQGEGLRTAKVTYVEDTVSEAERNWNLIGNPCLADYKPAYKGGGIGQTLVQLDNGENAHDIADLNYTVYSENGFLSYAQKMTTDVTIHPFNCYFIQIEFDAEVAFVRNDRAQHAPRRSANMYNDSDDDGDVKVAITLTQGQHTDRTTMIYGDNYTSAYDMNADLAKMFGFTSKETKKESPMTLYTLSAGQQMAYQAVSKESMPNAVPVGYRDVKTTPATFSFDESKYDRSGLVAVWLNDTHTGSIVNLLEEDYSFMPENASEEGRFYLSVVPMMVTNVTTGIEQTTDNSDEQLIYYDVMGRRVQGNYYPQNSIYVILDAQGNSQKVMR
ncbi:MAG: hypothetical protein K6A36_02510 [Paludibacteraceae bacterium]|nr:hypothetical protein [Paludibacteraceae bacterium]